jgi:hypothetical protein
MSELVEGKKTEIGDDSDAETIRQTEADCGNCENAAGKLFWQASKGAFSALVAAPLLIAEAMQLQNVVREAHE